MPALDKERLTKHVNIEKRSVLGKIDVLQNIVRRIGGQVSKSRLRPTIRKSIMLDRETRGGDSGRGKSAGATQGADEKTTIFCSLFLSFFSSQAAMWKV